MPRLIVSVARHKSQAVPTLFYTIPGMAEPAPPA
jgi:hypothetical protein